MSISKLTSAERWKNHGLIGEVQQEFEEQVNRSGMFDMDDNLQIEYRGTQATTKKAKATLKKLSGLYAVLNEIQGLNSVATADMLTKDIYSRCKKDYGISKKELQRLINDAQNGLVPQLQYDSEYDGVKLGEGEHYFTVEAAKEKINAEGYNGEQYDAQMKNRVTLHQNTGKEFDAIWKTEDEMDAMSFINKVKSEKKEARKNGIAYIEERVNRLREEQRVRPFQKVTLPQTDIVQCKKEYDLSKKEVEKISIEIQSKAGAAAQANNTEQQEPTEAVAVNAGEVNAEEVNAEAVNAEEVNAAAVNAEEVNAAAVNAEEVNAEAVNAEEVNAAAVNAEEVNAAAVNAEEVNAAAVNAEEVNAAGINISAEDLMEKGIEYFDAEIFRGLQERNGYTTFRTACKDMLDKITYDKDTLPVEVLVQYGKIKRRIHERYSLANAYLDARCKKADKERENLELLVKGTIPWDIKEEYRIKELKLADIKWNEKRFDARKKALANADIISGMTYRQFYDMHHYKKSFDMLAKEKEKLSRMQELYNTRSQLFMKKTEENGGIAIPAMEEGVSQTKKRMQELEASVARLTGIAEKRKKAFEKHEVYGDFSLESINKIYLRCGAEKMRQAAEGAESLLYAEREHIQFKKDYASAVERRREAVNNTYVNYSEEKLKNAYLNAVKEADIAKKSREKNREDYLHAINMYSNPEQLGRYKKYVLHTGQHNSLLAAIHVKGRLFQRRIRKGRPD